MTPSLCFKHSAHTLTGGAGSTELPSRSGAGTLQRERGSLRRPGSRVQGVGAGTGGVAGQGRGPEEGPREDDGTAAEAGGGAGGAAGQTVPAEEQQPQPGGPAQGAGGQVRAAIAESDWFAFSQRKSLAPPLPETLFLRRLLGFAGSSTTCIYSIYIYYISCAVS